MQFEPQMFLESPKYMGAGMLGIFIVMGVIIAVTYGLGRLFSSKGNKKDQQ